MYFSLDAQNEAWVGKVKGKKEQNEISHRSLEEEGLVKECFGRASRNEKWCLNLAICDVFLRVIFFFLFLML